MTFANSNLPKDGAQPSCSFSQKESRYKVARDSQPNLFGGSNGVCQKFVERTNGYKWCVKDCLGLETFFRWMLLAQEFPEIFQINGREKDRFL